MGNKLTKEKIKKEHRGNLQVRRVISIIFLNVWMDDTEHKMKIAFSDVGYIPTS